MLNISRFHALIVGVVLSIVSYSVMSANSPGQPGSARDQSSDSTWIVQFDAPPLTEVRRSLIEQQHQSSSPKASTIVQLTTPGWLASELAIAEQDLQQQQALSLEQLAESLGRAPGLRHRYRHAVNGIALRLSDSEAARLQANHPMWTLSKERIYRTHTDAGPAWVGAESVWQGGNGNLGEGAVIGVLDTGINSGHPAFAEVGEDGYQHINPRGRFYGLCQSGQVTCNNKLIGIYDFTDEGQQLGIDSIGHGSHVASIAAGNVRSATFQTSAVPLETMVSGVAPHANVISYKVCQVDDDLDGNPSGTCPGSAILAGLDQLAIDLPDVVNYSIGSDPDNPWVEPISLAMLNIRAAGTLIVTSAGNSGPDAFTVGSPANSPWLLSVANTTHDRAFIGSLINASGGSTALEDLNGASLTRASTALPIVHARDFGNALCGTGEVNFQNTCSEGVGSSNPFPPGTFSGQIVVCDRGVYGRLEKGINVLAGGAAGYILANTDEQAESTIADVHCLPAVHLGDDRGDRLREWLASGSDHRGQITAAELASDPSLGDIVSSSSSRGPALGIPGLMKPDIAAPGSSIYAASGTGSGQMFLSGTSMASPHVAGAAALLRSDHPEWGPDVLHSVLVTTALNEGMKDSDRITPARTTDVGAGRLRVDQAVNASVYLPVSRSDFLNSNPNTGGQPLLLNLPAISGLVCTPNCSITRELITLEAGQWQVSVDFPAGVQATVTPNQFSALAGQSVSLRLDATIFDPSRVGQSVEGLLIITPQNSPLADQRLPVVLNAADSTLPSRVSILTTDDRGTEEISLMLGTRINTLDYRVTGLSLPERTIRSLFVDDFPSTPFDDLNDGVLFELYQATAGESLLAQTVPVSNRDLDLFVGRDQNGDGLPEASELLCNSTGSGALERCLIDIEQTGSYWVLVQNVVSLNTRDGVFLEVARFGAPDDSLQVTGPGANPDLNSELSLTIAWEQPQMRPEQIWLGLLEFLDGRDADAATVAQTVIEVERVAATLQPDSNGVDLTSKAPQVLLQDQDAVFSLESGQAHGQLLVHVPMDASSLQVSVDSDVATTLYLIHEDDWLDASQQPSLAMATQVAVSSAGTAQASLTSAQIRPGQWRVVVTHSETGPMTATAQAVVQRSSSNQIDPIQGLWFNPDRDGAGFNLNLNQNTLVLEWYTYRPDGTPTWYLMQADYPQPGNRWQADLLFFNWDGSSAKSTDVGEVELVFESPTRLRFNYQLYGQHRSESYQAIVSSLDCISQGDDVALTGLWFVPGQAGFGYSILSLEGQQIQINYLYDQAGYPRWVYGQGAAAQGQTLTMSQFDGFCSYCESSGVTAVPVGRNITEFDSSSSASIDTSLQFQGTVEGDWAVSASISNLTPTFDCN